MAHLVYENVGRRVFIRTSLSAAGAALTLSSSRADDETDSPKKEIKWALLADTHVAANKDEVYRGFYPHKNLSRAVPGVLAAKVDAATIVGDVARSIGLPGDYATVRETLKPLTEKVPIFLELGNHDDRDAFFKAFAKSPEPGKRQAVKGKHVVVVDHAPIRFLFLDSLRQVNEGGGALGKPQFDWLETQLKNSDDKPTVICVHHTLGGGGSDLSEAETFLKLLDATKKVKLVCYGHSHHFRFTERQGLHLLNLPPLGYTFSDRLPLGWIEATLRGDGGDFKLHAIDSNTENNGTVTKLKWR